MARLSDDEIAAGLAGLPGWSRRGDEIEKHFERATFPDAITFVTRVGFLAERADHHPDLDLRWRTVRVGLGTHSEGGITGRDLSLAAEIERVASTAGERVD
ncbi:MAG: 4a-hydroxytetrahydrobiopterin dehydratase [Acidimicrobiia bacterium]